MATNNKHFNLGKIEAARVRMDAALSVIRAIEQEIHSYYLYDYDEDGNLIHDEDSKWYYKMHRPDPSNEDEREAYEKVLILEDMKEDFENWVIKSN